MKKLQYILIFLFFVPVILFSKKAENSKTFTIMLDPAGDAQNTGRQIDDYLERGITLQFAEKLKPELEDKFDDIRVVLTRFSGEAIEHLQNANFANRLDVDFYLSIHFYKEKAVKPNVYLYTFCRHDDFITKRPELYFYPYDQAHLINREQTKTCANVMRNVFLCDTHKKKFEFCGVFNLPFKPLLAVKAPAVGIEIGLRKKEDWKNYLDVFVDCVEEIIEN